MSAKTPKFASPKLSKFSIGQLMVLTFIVGAVLAPIAILGDDGMVLSGIVAAVVVVYWRRDYFAVLFGFAVFMILADVTAVMNWDRRPARRSVCLNNMRQLVLACQNYHSLNGKFPPPYTVDTNGKPLHSWRVLLLPYLDESNLYDAIDLTKPWNHPVNIKYTQQMPDVFLCPSSTNGNSNAMTSYLAVVGKETIWHPTAGGLSFDDVTDGCSNTIMILESERHQVNWMSPQDLSFDMIVDDSNTGICNLPNSGHPGGGQAALIDGSARYIGGSKTAASIKAALTVNAGDESDAFE